MKVIALIPAHEPIEVGGGAGRRPGGGGRAVKEEERGRAMKKLMKR
jgi:hypothetical protein